MGKCLFEKQSFSLLENITHIGKEIVEEAGKVGWIIIREILKHQAKEY